MPGFPSIPGSPQVPPHGPPGHEVNGFGPATQVQEGTFLATAYSPPFGRGSINGTGVTANGTDLTKPGDHYVIAAGPGSGLKLGDVVYISPNPYNNDGIGFTVADHGGMIFGKHIDIYVPTHAQAVAWGRRRVNVRLTGTGAAGKPTGPIVPNPADVLSSISDFLNKLGVMFTGAFWMRAGLVLAGLTLIAFGIVTIGRQYAVSSTLGKAFKK